MNITPKIKFHYSEIYDRCWQGWLKAMRPEVQYEFPSSDKVKGYIEEIKPIWNEKEAEVLTAISDITRLPWVDAETTCWVVGICRPFSDPLTIRVLKDKNDFMRSLTHEMIHQNFTQGRNEETSNKYWQMMREKYQGESMVTKSHIPVHAFLKHVLLQCFDQTWVDKDIQVCEGYPDYKRAWEIVETEGYQNIIKEFVESKR